jgi:hypothetical protein
VLLLLVVGSVVLEGLWLLLLLLQTAKALQKVIV